MSTTDSRAAFERIANAPLARHSIYTDQYDNTRTQDLWSMFQAALSWQAATEAAKATGTAGELIDNFQQAWAKFSDGTHKSPRDIGLHFWEAAMQYADAGNEEFRKDVKRLVERCCDAQAENLALKAEAARQPAPVVAVTRIDTGYGNYLEFERKTTGKSGWLVRTESGDLVRALNPTEVLLVDSALAAKALPILKVVRGEICYKSEADDQSYGMWCPVTPEYSPAYVDGTEFYAITAATNRSQP